MNTQTVETVYSPALALSMAFAVQELIDAREAHEANPTIHTEAREYLATLKVAKPEVITALLRHIDELEGKQERKRK